MRPGCHFREWLVRVDPHAMQRFADNMYRLHNADNAAYVLKVAGHPDMQEPLSKHTIVVRHGIVHWLSNGRAIDKPLKCVVNHLDHISRYRVALQACDGDRGPSVPQVAAVDAEGGATGSSSGGPSGPSASTGASGSSALGPSWASGSTSYACGQFPRPAALVLALRRTELAAVTVAVVLHQALLDQVPVVALHHTIQSHSAQQHRPNFGPRCFKEARNIDGSRSTGMLAGG